MTVPAGTANALHPADSTPNAAAEPKKPLLLMFI
jgi:hypothetical protein